MPQLSPLVQQPPAALEQALQRLGRNIRTARLRRRWRLEDVAERMGVSRFTVADVERGKPGTSIAAYLGALWVLGLLDQLEAVADPDRDGEGKALEAARQPSQAPAAIVSTTTSDPPRSAVSPIRLAHPFRPPSRPALALACHAIGS